MGFNNQCAWSLTVSYNDEFKTVSYPLTCEFNIERNRFSTAKYATINIYNLAPSTRQSELFRQDRILDLGKTGNKIVSFSAGYNGNFITCFTGIIVEAYSTRRSTDVITTIQATDMGASYENLQPISITFKAETTFVDAFNYIAGKLQYIKAIDRGTLEGTFKTDTTFVGTPLQILNQLTNNHTFIDNARLFCLNNNECTSKEPWRISGSTNLLDVPMARENWMTIKTIFNPYIDLGQRVIVDSMFNKNNPYTSNGTYTVFSVNHQGIISGAVGGQRTTTIGMQLQESLPNSNVNITAQTEKQGPMIVEGTDVYSDSPIDVQNVYKYIKDNNGAIPPWKINERISWAEMIGNDNTSAQRLAQLTPEKLTNCVIIADKLVKFLNSTSLKGQRIHIESGWRSIENNSKCGGQRESAHLRGSAIDFYFINTNTEDAYKNIISKQWDKFTYPYRYGATGSLLIHVQSTLGKGGAGPQQWTTIR